jgi:WD40 repeat protein
MTGNRLLVVYMLLAALLAGPPRGLAQPPHLDVDGKPLPPGALARFGSTGMRHKKAITFLGFTGAQRLMAASADGDLRLWDVSSGKEVRRQAVPQRVEFGKRADQSPILSQDGKTLAWLVDGGVRVEDAGTGKELRRFTGDQLAKQAKFGAPDTVLLSTDGQLICVTGWDGQEKARFALWKTTSGALVRTLDLGDDNKRRVVLAAVSNDGSRVAALEFERKGKIRLRLWDTTRGQQIAADLQTEGRHAGAVQFLPDGKSLVLSIQGSTVVSLFDADTGKELRRFTAPQPLDWVKASPDGKRLFTAEGGFFRNDRAIHLWDIATGKELRQFPNTSGIGERTVAAVSPDGKTLAVGHGSTFRLWDVDTGKEVKLRPGHASAVLSVAFAPQGDRVATAAMSAALLWDAATGRLERELPFTQDRDAEQSLRQVGLFPGRFNAARVAFAPDGLTVASLTVGNPLRRWEAATGKPLPPWPNAPSFVTGFAYTPNGKLLALTGLGGGVRLLDPATGKTVQKFGTFLDTPEARGEPPSLGIATLSPDGRVVFSSALTLEGPGMSMAASTIEGWEVWTGKRRLRIHNPLELSSKPQEQFDQFFVLLEQLTLTLVVAPDGKRLASASYVTIKLHDLPGGREARLFGAPGLLPATVVFSPDGKLLLAGRQDGSVRVWDAVTGTVLGDLPLHEAAVTALAFAPDGRRLASGSADTTALLWDWPALRRRLTVAAKAPAPEALWQALGGDDAGAQEALAALAATPGPAIALLKAQLKPVPPADPARLEKLLADLDGKQFAARAEATRELEKLGDLAAAALRKRLAGKLTLEAQRRLEAILDRLDGPPPPPLLQALRAVEVLEHIGTPEARHVLDALAAGAAGHRLTTEAAASVLRLQQRADLP